jgi:hypothetical protein
LENTRKEDRSSESSQIVSNSGSDSFYNFTQNALLNHMQNTDYIYTANKSSVIRSALRLADKYFGTSKFNSQNNNSSSQSEQIISSYSNSSSNNSISLKSDISSKPLKNVKNKTIAKEEQGKYGKTVTDYSLYENSDLEPSTPSLLTHQYLPSNYRDKEHYKHNLFKFLRKPEYSDHKTDACKQLLFRNSRQSYGKYIITILDGNLTKYNSIYGMKRKKVFSEKKIFNAERGFKDPYNKEIQLFKVYTDKTIGFDLRWQKPLKCAVNFFII